MLERELTLRPGEVLSEDGNVIGTHKGAARYTLGERHGFTLAASSPDTLPHFVIAKDIKKNTITISASRLPRGVSQTEILLRETNWIGDVESGSCETRFRYRQKLIPAKFKGSTVTLFEPHFVPLGQSLVLYKGERCLGGGIITSATLK
jgi:tRNA-specific 2-thiouridylase